MKKPSLLSTVLFFVASPLLAQSNACIDGYPHRVRLVETGAAVHIEALDWGGDGPALVLLAGLGNTAHVFDDFAVHFSPEFRVVGITRRGYGASARPTDGYDVDNRVRDIVRVLDELGIESASFAGHSIAGDELSRIGAALPNRVDKLVYLDAFAYGPEVVGTFPRPPQNVPQSQAPARDTLSNYHRLAGQLMRSGFRFPMSELCQPEPEPSAGGKIIQGTHTVQFESVDVPTLGLFASPRRLHDAYPDYDSYSIEQREAVRNYLNTGESWRLSQISQFESRMPQSESVIIDGANHYVFLSHEREVARLMLEFLEAN